MSNVKGGYTAFKPLQAEVLALRAEVARLTAELAALRERDTSNLTSLMERVRIDNERWWRNLETGEMLERNVGELLALIHSEISEALEGHRKGLMDDHLPQYPMFTVELADAVIRILDTAAHLAPNMPEALLVKLDYNRQREDHKEESRRLANGKKY